MWVLVLPLLLTNVDRSVNCGDLRAIASPAWEKIALDDIIGGLDCDGIGADQIANEEYLDKTNDHTLCWEHLGNEWLSQV